MTTHILRDIHLKESNIGFLVLFPDWFSLTPYLDLYFTSLPYSFSCLRTKCYRSKISLHLMKCMASCNEQMSIFLTLFARYA